MKLTLDHTQRLNLHALLGAQRADVGSIRAIWAVQDRIALDADEEKAVELKREMVAGQERVVWNPALSIPPRISSSPIRRSRASRRRSRRGTRMAPTPTGVGCNRWSRFLRLNPKATKPDLLAAPMPGDHPKSLAASDLPTE